LVEFVAVFKETGRQECLPHGDFKEEEKMCCVISTLLAMGPRLAILVWWLIDSVRFDQSFGRWEVSGLSSLPGWLLPLLACLFLPWTSLAYLIFFPGGIVGADWIWLGVGLLMDLSSHGGGLFSSRQRRHHHRRHDD
jgi:hypothetical protein